VGGDKVLTWMSARDGGILKLRKIVAETEGKEKNKQRLLYRKCINPWRWMR
jgi:hypothetical protein